MSDWSPQLHPPRRRSGEGAVLVLALLWMPFGAILYTYGLSVLWRWFAVPLGAPVLGLAHLYGLAVIASLLTSDTHPNDGRDNDLLTAAVVSILTTVFRVGFALAAGWVALQFMGGAS